MLCRYSFKPFVSCFCTYSNCDLRCNRNINFSCRLFCSISNKNCHEKRWNSDGQTRKTHATDWSFQVRNENYFVILYQFINNFVFLYFFSTLFVIPSAVYLVTLTYEYANFDDWMLQWNRMTCKKFSIPCPPSSIVNDANKPVFSVFILKYVSLMLIGITSGLTWLCSSKTIASWKTFFNRTGRKPVSANFV